MNLILKRTLQLSFVFVFLSSCKAQNATIFNSSAIENGLVPKFYIDEGPKSTYAILDRLNHYKVPGISIGIFENNKVVFMKGYGFKNSKTKERVDTETKFQIASLGKAVTALGIFKLIAKYDLDIHGDINEYLKNWQINDPRFSTKEKITIARLLRHTSGIKSFGGYVGIKPTEKIIPIKDVLEGKEGFPKIELDRIPGSSMSYSSGSFAVLQYIIEEVSMLPFETFMQREVFEPLGMTHSSFNQFPSGNVSLAHTFNGKPNPNKWLVHPAMAAGGLWTTPSDLCKFLIAINTSYQGEEDTIISQQMALKMLETGKGWGLGVGLRGTDENAMFFHGGSNPGGFCALMISGYQRGIGIVILNNGEGGNPIRDEIAGAFSKYYNFNYTAPKVYKTVEIKKSELEKYVGRYQWKERAKYFLNITIDDKDNIILSDENDGGIYTFVPITNGRFLDVKEETIISFTKDPASNKVIGIDYDGSYIFYKVK